MVSKRAAVHDYARFRQSARADIAFDIPAMPIESADGLKVNARLEALICFCRNTRAATAQARKNYASMLKSLHHERLSMNAALP